MKTVRKYFRDIPIGALIAPTSDPGQNYRKRSGRTIETAPGHSHHAAGKWFYAAQSEVFIVKGE